MNTQAFNDGRYKDVLPLIHNGEDWITCIPWIFSKGLWRRLYDPGFVNIITNSRLINGTDVSVTQGKVSGVTPVGWTLSTITAGSSYSISNFTQEEQVKNIRFVSEQSRHFYVTRFQVEAGETYTASANIERINVKNPRKSLQVLGETASIEIDVDFLPTSQMQLGRNSIHFTARTSGIVQFRMGACVDASGDADIIISRPQVTRSFMNMEWQPTPIVPPFYGVNLINSYMSSKLITYSDGEYNIDATIKLESNRDRPNMLFGRDEQSGFSGIAFDEDKMYLYSSGRREKEVTFSKSIPLKRLVGIKVIWKKSGNYVSDVRFYLNSELIGRIQSTMYSGNIDSLFGYQGNKTTNLTVQSFSMQLDSMYMFNLDEGEGFVIKDRQGHSLTLYGNEFIDFVWVRDSSVPIIITDATDQSAEIGEYARFFADATFYISAQWFKDGNPIPNATSSEYFIQSVSESDYGTYQCVFQNEYGKESTSLVRLKSTTDKSMRLLTERNDILTTEDGTIILTEA